MAAKPAVSEAAQFVDALEKFLTANSDRLHLRKTRRDYVKLSSKNWIEGQYSGSYSIASRLYEYPVLDKRPLYLEFPTSPQAAGLDFPTYPLATIREGFIEVYALAHLKGDAAAKLRLVDQLDLELRRPRPCWRSRQIVAGLYVNTRTTFLFGTTEVVIRRPTPDEASPYFAPFFSGLTPTQTPHAVLEFVTEQSGVVSARASQEAGKQLVAALMFCLLKPVVDLRHEMSLSPFGRSTYAISGQGPDIPQPIQLSRRFLSRFSRVWQMLDIEKLPLWEPNPTDPAVSVAMDQLFETIHSRIWWREHRVASSVMGLEAILVRDNKELAFRVLAAGCAVARMLKRDVRQTERILKLAYEIRSTYAHGSRVSNDKWSKSLSNIGLTDGEFLVQLSSCLRDAILCKMTFGTGDLPKALVEATIHPETLQTLSKRCKCNALRQLFPN